MAQQTLVPGETSTGATQTLAAFLAAVRYDDLPPQVIADAKLAILDWLGSALSGALEEPARIARTVARGFGTSDEASLLPEGRGSAPAAALANGVASHILEFDDVHRGSTIHGAAPMIVEPTPGIRAVSTNPRRRWFVSSSRVWRRAPAGPRATASRSCPATSPTGASVCHLTTTSG